MTELCPDASPSDAGQTAGASLPSRRQTSPSWLISLAGVYARLNAACASRGGKQRLADRAGVSRQFVDAVEKGAKRPSPSLLRALGLEEVTFYKEIQNG